MAKKHANYHAYMLRLWRADEATPWHASLHSVATEQLQHFADVDALFSFLLAQLEGDERGAGRESRRVDVDANVSDVQHDEMTNRSR